MANIDVPPGEGSERERLWSLRPELAAAASGFDAAVQNHSILPIREAEAARVRIAHINGCEPCSAARIIDGEAEFGLDESFYADLDDPAKRGRYSARERLAIEFAERFDKGKTAFDPAFWDDLKSAFSTAEILDLSMSIAKWLAMGRLNAVFDLVPVCPIRMPAPRRASAGEPVLS